MPSIRCPQNRCFESSVLLVALLSLLPFAPATAAESVLHSFAGGADGANPIAEVIEVKGKLYGTTANGGTDSQGTVFVIDTKTGVEKVVLSFDGGASGGQPLAGFIDVKGTLYGTTREGGVGCGSGYGCGTVFALNPKSGVEKVLLKFPNSEIYGTGPEAGVIDQKGILYGTTAAGGSDAGGNGACNGYGCGTVFALNPQTGSPMVLYTFCAGGIEGGECPDGAAPVARLIDFKGVLYGTTPTGGATNSGVIFAVNPVTGAETVVHSFGDGDDGAISYAGLINVKGTLYGTTFQGGSGSCELGCGTVFAFNPQTGNERVVYSFQTETDGMWPEAGLIEVNGMLYGTTSFGGTAGYGTVFELNPRTGAESLLYSFCSQQNCTDGRFPQGTLINVNGTLYGTTIEGGTGSCDMGCGTVFAITP